MYIYFNPTPDQWAIIKFCSVLGETTTEAFEMTLKRWCIRDHWKPTTTGFNSWKWRKLRKFDGVRCTFCCIHENHSETHSHSKHPHESHLNERSWKVKRFTPGTLCSFPHTKPLNKHVELFQSPSDHSSGGR